MRATRLAIITGMGLALALPAAAEELRLGFETSLEYDDNIFNTREDSNVPKEDDLVFRVGPEVQLRRVQGDFTYVLDYALRWESFIEESGADAFDHTAFGRATWRVGPRTEITATERFLYTRSLNRSTFIEDPADPDAVVVPEVELGRQLIKTNVASLGASHQFTPRLEGNANLGYTLFRYSQENRNDSDTFSGAGSLQYTLTERDRVGGGIGVTWQTFDVVTGADSETFYYRLFGTWSHLFDPTMSLTLQVGPTLIDSDPTGGAPTSGVVPAFPFRDTAGGGLRLVDSTTCPTVDDGQPFASTSCGLFPATLTGAAATTVRNSFRAVELVDDRSELGTRLTLFADLRFIKAWETWRLQLSYRRTDTTSSGVGQASILDLAQVQLGWTPSQRWRFELVGSWAHRESATDQAVSVVGLAPVEFCPAPPVMGMCPVATIPGSQSINLRLFETDQATDITTWTATFEVRRRLRRASDVFLRFRYLLQEQDSDFQDTSDLDNFRVMLGVRWWFDPIVL